MENTPLMFFYKRGGGGIYFFNVFFWPVTALRRYKFPFLSSADWHGDAIHLSESLQSSMLKNTFSIKNYFAYLSVVGIFIWMPMPVYSQAIITTLGSAFPMTNGSDLSAWKANKGGSGNASWQIDNKVIKVTQGHGLLVSRLSVPDFQVAFDYWVSDKTQATVFFRCVNSDDINTDTAYEVTLVNQAGDSGAGSILSLNKLKPTQVANQWNHMQIDAIGTQLSVTLNGVTHQVRDTRFGSGPIAINYLGGELRLKNVYITIPGRW